MNPRIDRKGRSTSPRRDRWFDRGFEPNGRTARLRGARVRSSSRCCDCARAVTRLERTFDMRPPHFSVAPVGRRARTPGAMARKKGKARPGGSASAPVPPGEDAPPPDAAATDRGDADPRATAPSSPRPCPHRGGGGRGRRRAGPRAERRGGGGRRARRPGVRRRPGSVGRRPRGSSPARGPPSSCPPMRSILISPPRRARAADVRGRRPRPLPPLAAARRSSENLSTAAAAAAGAAATEVASASPPEVRPAGTMGKIDYGLGLRSRAGCSAPSAGAALQPQVRRRRSGRGGAEDRAQGEEEGEEGQAPAKRLVHRTNTMGAAVSAKEQTTTQLGLCMQIGVALGLADQPPANTFEDVSDEHSSRRRTSRSTSTSSRSRWRTARPSAFRFVVHAPSRFERACETRGGSGSDALSGSSWNPPPDGGVERGGGSRRSACRSPLGGRGGGGRRGVGAEGDAEGVGGLGCGRRALRAAARDSEARRIRRIVGEPPETGSRGNRRRRGILE